MQRDFKLEGVPIRFIIKKAEGATVKTGLLKQGRQSRRGVGQGEARGVGPRRRSPQSLYLAKRKMDARRRRDSRIRRARRK